MDMQNWIDEHSQLAIDTSDKIWEYAELKWKEYKSAALLKSILNEHGFRLIENVADIPTAFIAEYGSEKPVIALLGEYDALPGMSQKPVPYKDPIEEGGPGHGCGHNLLGVAPMMACLALKQAIDAKEIQATIRYYGCPAEEGGSAKVYMVRDGAFQDVDIALTWHPEAINMVNVQNSEAVIKVLFKFHGTSAHAASDPHRGRSALDAVELMNVGANYLREHITTQGKMHYIITKGGDAPNIVPEYAESYYYIRAPNIRQVNEIFERLKKVANGAAVMTETSVNIEQVGGCSNYLSNSVVEEVLQKTMEKIGAPKFDTEDEELAQKFEQTIPVKFIDAIRSIIPAEFLPLAQVFEGKVLCDVNLPIFGRDITIPGSTDVADVCWVVPTGEFKEACYSISTPGHSWQRVAQNKSSIAYKGMINAARILAEASVEFIKNPELISKAQGELHAKLEKDPYISPLEPGAKVPFHVN
ncbi:MAG: amidohydrolase [Candidatus Lokiarchaeota archaeon]|nr:amidohydrolase [Candidatus Lokiarchaeota archaeon]